MSGHGYTSTTSPRFEHEKGALTRELLTTKEAAAYFRVHPSTIRRWKKEGHLPYVRLGTGKGRNRTIRYRLMDLRAVTEEKAHHATRLRSEAR